MMTVKLLMFVLLAGGVLVAGRPAQDETGSCDINASERVECGWFGIDQETCEKRGCCWDSGTPNAKFCFVKKGIHMPPEMCPISPADRKDCGYFGIQKDECVAKGCCWDDTVPGAKYCYHGEGTYCYIYSGVSGVCRYSCKPGESKVLGMGACMGTVCCYNVPWSR